jgi:hypothetical protein
VSALPEPVAEPAVSAATVDQVWLLLGKADVIVRGCLEARDRVERRLWEERARAWLLEVNRAWVRGTR